MGLVLRFANLDRKVYWHDEVYTSLRTAGYQGPVVEQAVADRPDLTAADLMRYQQLPPTPSLADCWQALSANPEHPPLYYLLAHAWGRLFGASVGGYRAIAAIFGAIALPLIFWLTRQLFPQQPVTAWLAMALLAVSPVHLVYSQEAREYTLWIVGLLLANGTLVRALRQKSPVDWAIYGLALGLTWYGSLMTVLLGLSHLGFMVLSERRLRAWLGFGLAQGLGLGLFLPWIGTIVSRWQRLQAVTAWTRAPAPLEYLAQRWGMHYSVLAIDFNLPYDHLWTVLGAALVLGLGTIALVCLWRSYPRSTALFLGCGLLIPPLVLIGHDVIEAAQLSRNTRYFFPSLVLMPVAIAALITHWLTFSQRWVRRGGAGLLILLLALGLASGVSYGRADTWSNKGFSATNRWIANDINQRPNPMVIVNPSHISLGEAISLSYYLKPETPMWLLSEPVLPSPDALQTAHPQGALLVYKPDSALLKTLSPDWQAIDADPSVQFFPHDLVTLMPPPGP
ncbi:glycosyltransferase family 39 protein [Nodosilinea sp. LEGE 07088]|uniref:glycosyltransferase family 39 protein n=1 Tax=Nodosilinea sp. LEGE 07088 TaxID=2777968 RepID=UPI0028BEDED1|nr:glycosyltransferase family 39 protein [Nodosilinea sp. LEGE 07088]